MQDKHRQMYPGFTTITDLNRPKCSPSYDLLLKNQPTERRNNNINSPSIVLENLDNSESDKIEK